MTFKTVFLRFAQPEYLHNVDNPIKNNMSFKSQKALNGQER